MMNISFTFPLNSSVTRVTLNSKKKGLSQKIYSQLVKKKRKAYIYRK